MAAPAHIAHQVAFARAMGHARPRRRRLPRQIQPNGIRLEYFKAIVAAVVAPLEQALRARLYPTLARLLAAAPPAVRHDDTKRSKPGKEDAARILEEIRSLLGHGVRQPELADLARRFAARTDRWQKAQLERQVRAALGVEIFAREPHLEPIMRDFAAENAALIRRIPEQRLADVESRTFEAFRTGRRWEDLAKDLEDRLGVTESKARLIARDQVGRLYAQLNEVRQQALGVTRFRWETVHDDRVRPEHADLDGQEFSWDDPPDGDDGPITPGSEINCRCFATPLFDEILESLDDS